MVEARGREIDVARLCGAMQRASLVLRPFREERLHAVRQFVGSHYSEEGAREPVPVNLLSLYVSVVGRNLIAKNPRVMLSTFDRSLKPTVAAMQDWANKEIQQIHLQDTLQRIVTDALFSIGIGKVALATPADSASVAWRLGAGQPFAERVDLDDFVCDPHARDFGEVSFIGHRFRVPLEVVRDSKLYTKARKDLTPSTDKPYNLEGDERIKQLGQQYMTGFTEEFEDHVDLWEVYLPRHRLVLTLADDDLTGPAGSGSRTEALRVQNWVGPDAGPYHILSLGVVPGNAMPKGPIQDLVDLHEAANRTYRKLIRSVDRLKELAGVAAGQMEDATRVMQANDGDILRVDNPELIRQFMMGGQGIQHLVAVATLLKDQFAYQAGNLDVLGGLSPQSKTLGQDQMLAQNASRVVADMQDRTVDYASGMLKALCWYWYHDPFLVQRSQHSLPGMPGMQIQRQVTPQQRQQGRFEDVQIEVDPYSLQHQTPSQKLQALNQVVTQIVLPMMQLLVQQGISLDVNAYLRKAGDYLDAPDLAEILTIQEPPEQQTQTAGEAGSKPAQTTRSYVRQNMPGQTREASDRNTIQSALGINPGGNPAGSNQPQGMR